MSSKRRGGPKSGEKKGNKRFRNIDFETGNDIRYSWNGGITTNSHFCVLMPFSFHIFYLHKDYVRYELYGLLSSAVGVQFQDYTYINQWTHLLRRNHVSRIGWGTEIHKSKYFFVFLLKSHNLVKQTEMSLDNNNEEYMLDNAYIKN